MLCLERHRAAVLVDPVAAERGELDQTVDTAEEGG
jgi:hypothetical protein